MPPRFPLQPSHGIWDPSTQATRCSSHSSGLFFLSVSSSAISEVARAFTERACPPCFIAALDRCSRFSAMICISGASYKSTKCCCHPLSPICLRSLCFARSHLIFRFSLNHSLPKALHCPLVLARSLAASVRFEEPSLLHLWLSGNAAIGGGLGHLLRRRVGIGAPHQSFVELSCVSVAGYVSGTCEVGALGSCRSRYPLGTLEASNLIGPLFRLLSRGWLVTEMMGKCQIQWLQSLRQIQQCLLFVLTGRS